MKQYCLFVFIFLMHSCDSKSQSNISKIENETFIKNHRTNLNGKQIVEELDKLNFFNLTQESEVDEEKRVLEESYNEHNFFEGDLRGETLNFVDNRFYFVDGEELFEIGGLVNYLKIVKPVFEKLGLELNYSNGKSIQTDKYWKHTIKLNGREYIAFESNFGKLDWGIAYVNFIKMLNSELSAQKSEERFYPISCKNDGRIVLLTPKQFEFVKKHYPNDEEHPQEIEIWKKENNIK
ncbi:MAG: hypothetical protein P0Y62_15590 [Candidatus Chryseobacterium colombiense]|nr:hypothetical protein [Chryseobacterium sp.]WEK69259.1 MAG: hypothetical protein P0Y62_15590 [Chryseobacterium sp.]